MTVEINPNPALSIAVDPTDTFSDYQEKIIKKSKRQLRHGNGQPIELQPDSIYTTLLMKVKYLLSTEKFYVLEGIIGQSIMKAVMDGVIEPDWFQGITTPLDLHTPPIPEQFQEEGHEIKMFLSGETKFVVSKNPLPEVIVDDE